MSDGVRCLPFPQRTYHVTADRILVYPPHPAWHRVEGTITDLIAYATRIGDQPYVVVVLHRDHGPSDPAGILLYGMEAAHETGALGYSQLFLEELGPPSLARIRAIMADPHLAITIAQTERALR